MHHDRGQYRSNNNVFFECHYHVIFCPKYRKKVLVKGIERRLKQIIQDVCQDHEVIVEAMEVMPDHVHLLLNVDPQFGVNKIVKLIKGRSSHLLHEEFPKLAETMPTLWTNSWFVSTVGRATFETVQAYILNQKDNQAGPQLPDYLG